MKKKLLIVGASSCLANAISGSLKDSGYSIFGTYNNNYPKDPENYEALLKIDFLNKTEINDINSILNSVDNIIFTVGDSNYLDENESKKNIDTISNLINHLKNFYPKWTKRIIFCSSSSVYGDSDEIIISEDSKKNPVSIYAKNKLLGENILIESSLPYVILRFPIIFGNSFKAKFIRLKEVVIKGRSSIFGDGNNQFSFIHEKDLIGPVSSILEMNSIINTDINLSGESVKQTDFVNQLYQIINKKVTPKNTKIGDAFECAEREMDNFRKNGVRPTLFKEDVVSFSRDRTFDCSKAKKILNWTPKYGIIKAIKDTFQDLNFIERSEGIRILNFLFPDKILPVKIYKNYNDFKVRDFLVNNTEDAVWSATVRDEEGAIINTGHIFSRNPETIRWFMMDNKSDTKSYSIRVSPPKEDILYYGSFLNDWRNFGEKVIVTLSRKSSAQFLKNIDGESFKLLPRDLDPEETMTYLDGKFIGNTVDFDKYLPEIQRDIEKVKEYIKITKREYLIMPLLFIINVKKGIQYISMGF